MTDSTPGSAALKDLTCPYCGGDLAYWLDLTPEGPGPSSQIQCLACGATWDGQFKAESAPDRGTK